MNWEKNEVKVLSKIYFLYLIQNSANNIVNLEIDKITSLNSQFNELEKSEVKRKRFHWNCSILLNSKKISSLSNILRTRIVAFEEG